MSTRGCRSKWKALILLKRRAQTAGGRLCVWSIQVSESSTFLAGRSLHSLFLGVVENEERAIQTFGGVDALSKVRG